jgi:DNA-binding transcriptional MerR regulator/methylmalonyl-CoA mutase cobalamin-binding subunit
MSSKKADTGSSEAARGAWPMGAVTRRTGISEHTLRAWERRFGFPQPVRLASGHRRYTDEQVNQLLLIARALDRGYRAGDVVPLPAAELEALVRGFDRGREASAEQATQPWIRSVLDNALALDAAAIDSTLRTDAAVLGVAAFVQDRVVPLIDQVGAAWEQGELDVRHEHLISEVIEGRLRALRSSFEATASGRPVVLACLPEEQHRLGLQLAALEIAAAGRRVLVLGLQSPIDEIVAAAEAADAAAVGLSVSSFAPAEATLESVAELRSALPSRTELWVGGAGAADLEPLPEGVSKLSAMDEVAAAVRALPS